MVAVKIKPNRDYGKETFNRYVRIGRYLPPTTKATLRPYKAPLTAVEGGFGFMGTIAQNEVKTHIQCHICGYFFGGLTRHLTAAHSITAREYRALFELSAGTGLVSDSVKAVYRRNNLNQTPAIKAARVAAFAAAGRSAIIQAKATRNQNQSPFRNKSLERKNKEGRCFYQLLDKIETLAKELNRTPTRREFAKRWGGGFEASIRRTFGSWNQAITMSGLPTNKREDFLKSKTRFAREGVIELFHTFVAANGRMPRVADLGDTLPSFNTINRLFGGIIKAREAAGYGLADYVHERETI